MKILMFGRGVIATQYAWAFEKAGNFVEFYVRPGRKAEFGTTVALNILDARTKIRGISIKENWDIALRETFDASHDYDLIFLSVQHYDFKNAIDFLTDKIGKATVLVFNNVWDEPKQLVAGLPESQLIWGFPQAGGGFNNKGVLNGAFLSSIYMETTGNDQNPQNLEVIKLFKVSGFKVKPVKDFRSWLFSHFVLDAAIHLESLKSLNGLTSIDEMQTTGFWRNVFANGKELIPLLVRRDVDIVANPQIRIFSLPPWLLSLAMKIIINFLPPFKQILTGHSNHFELKSYCQGVMNKAEELNVDLPRYTYFKKIYQ